MTKSRKYAKAKRANRVRVARGQAPPLPPRRAAIMPAPIVVSAPATRRRVPRRRNGGNSGGMGIGSRIGAFLGGGAQKLFKMVTGFGDYKVENNTLVGGNVPNVQNTPGGFIVRHREYITDIYAASIFTNTVFSINPGLSGVFPWLATVASSFEEYSFRGLIFEYKSMSADNVLSTTTTSTALGTVIMATQYNSLSNNFIDKRTMENYEFANSSKPSLAFVHPIECKANLDANTHLYVRTGATFLGDQRLYDIGDFQIAVQGMAFTGGVIGELWATYEIEFFLNQKLLSVLIVTLSFCNL